MRLVAIASLLALAAPARADERAVAEALYDQAKQLVAGGKLAEACPKFAASFKADPQLGVLLNLADCHEKIGKTATAWAEFRDAVERAAKQGDKRVDYAQKRVDALAARLARVKIVAPARAVTGLVVQLDGTDVTALVGSDVPVDPGEHAIVATAPGRESWHGTTTAGGDGTTVSAQIGELEAAPGTGSGKRFGGVIVLAGASTDGVVANPSSCSGGSGQVCGHGVSGVLGAAVSARVRLHVLERVSFDPGVGFHIRRVDTQMCSGGVCTQADDIRLFDIELFAPLRYHTTDRLQLGVLAGPYATIRVGASNSAPQCTDPTVGTTTFDVGLVAAFEVFYGRWGGQIQLQYGLLHVSTVLDSPLYGIGLAVGARI